MKDKLNRFCIGLFVISIVLAMIILVKGYGTQGKSFGPGSYYYSDIPGWEQIFYK